MAASIDGQRRLTDLPLETLQAVFRELHAADEFSTDFRLVCKRFNDITTPMTYEQVSLRPDNALFGRKAYADYVKATTSEEHAQVDALFSMEPTFKRLCLFTVHKRLMSLVQTLELTPKHRALKHRASNIQRYVKKLKFSGDFDLILRSTNLITFPLLTLIELDLRCVTFRDRPFAKFWAKLAELPSCKIALVNVYLHRDELYDQFVLEYPSLLSRVKSICFSNSFSDNSEFNKVTEKQLRSFKFLLGLKQAKSLEINSFILGASHWLEQKMKELGIHEKRLPPYESVIMSGYVWRPSPHFSLHFFDWSRITTLHLNDTPVAPFIEAVGVQNMKTLTSLSFRNPDGWIPYNSAQTNEHIRDLLSAIRVLECFDIHMNFFGDSETHELVTSLGKHADSLWKLSLDDAEIRYTKAERPAILDTLAFIAESLHAVSDLELFSQRGLPFTGSSTWFAKLSDLKRLKRLQLRTCSISAPAGSEEEANQTAASLATLHDIVTYMMIMKKGAPLDVVSWQARFSDSPTFTQRTVGGLGYLPRCVQARYFGALDIHGYPVVSVKISTGTNVTRYQWSHPSPPMHEGTPIELPEVLRAALRVK